MGDRHFTGRMTANLKILWISYTSNSATQRTSLVQNNWYEPWCHLAQRCVRGTAIVCQEARMTNTNNMSWICKTIQLHCYSKFDVIAQGFIHLGLVAQVKCEATSVPETINTFLTEQFSTVLLMKGAKSYGNKTINSFFSGRFKDLSVSQIKK